MIALGVILILILLLLGKKYEIRVSLNTMGRLLKVMFRHIMKSGTRIVFWIGAGLILMGLKKGD